MKLTVDRNRCCGGGMCALTAPEIFDQDPRSGRVVLLNASPPAAVLDIVRDAVYLCPTNAISLRDR